MTKEFYCIEAIGDVSAPMSIHYIWCYFALTADQLSGTNCVVQGSSLVVLFSNSD